MWRTVVEGLNLTVTPPFIVYHGNRARFLYFQCLQLFLRKQVSTLIELWKLPPEFEVRSVDSIRHRLPKRRCRTQSVCRDVWALHLSFLPSPPPAAPLDDAGEDAGAGEHSERAKPGKEALLDELRPETRGRRRSTSGERRRARSTSSVSSSGSSTSLATSSSEDEDDAGKEGEHELEELMRQLSDSERSSDDGGAAPRGSNTDGGLKRRRKGNPPQESPMGNLSVLVVACWTMRLPVLYRDLIRCVARGHGERSHS